MDMDKCTGLMAVFIRVNGAVENSQAVYIADCVGNFTQSLAVHSLVGQACLQLVHLFAPQSSIQVEHEFIEVIEF